MTISLHLIICQGSRKNISLEEHKIPKSEFISWEKFKLMQNQLDSSKNSFVIVEDDSELSSNESQIIINLIEEIFNDIMKETRLQENIFGSKLDELFIKEQAGIEFLVRSQNIMSKYGTLCQFSKSKFLFLQKIISILVHSFIKRHNSNKIL